MIRRQIFFLLVAISQSVNRYIIVLHIGSFEEAYQNESPLPCHKYTYNHSYFRSCFLRGETLITSTCVKATSFL
jgi:hypothetical protein